MTQEALKLALEALEEAWIFSVSKFQPTEKAIDLYDEARAAIKEALAQTQEPWCMKMNGCKTKCKDCPDEPPERTEQEPVAWQFFQGEKWHNGMEFHDHRKHTIAAGTPVRDLYTTQPQRTWVGLTNNDWNSTPYTAEFRAGAEWADDKLKEKNT